MKPKCKTCNSCLDLVYFGFKRFWHCWLCNVWYDGLNDSLYVVDNDTINKYLKEYKVSPEELDSSK